MVFNIIDVYDSQVQGKPFDVVTLYEADSHQTLKIWYPFTEERHKLLNEFFFQNAYDIVNDYISYTLKDGKVKVKFTPLLKK